MNLIRASPSFECHTCFYPRVKCFHHKFSPESCCFGGIRGRKTTSLLEHHLPPEWCHTWDCESASCLSALLRVFPSTWGRSCSPHGASVRTDPNGGKDKKLTEKKTLEPHSICKVITMSSHRRPPDIWSLHVCAPSRRSCLVFVRTCVSVPAVTFSSSTGEGETGRSLRLMLPLLLLDPVLL